MSGVNDVATLPVRNCRSGPVLNTSALNAFQESSDHRPSQPFQAAQSGRPPRHAPQKEREGRPDKLGFYHLEELSRAGKEKERRATRNSDG